MTRHVPTPERGLVFEFEDEGYRLVYDMRAIAFFEREADISIVEAMQAIDEAQRRNRMPKVSHIAFLIQAGLQKHHGDVGLDDAARMATDPDVMDALGGSLGEAMGGSDTGDGDGGEPGNVKAPARKRGTGTRSGKTPSKRTSRRKRSGS